MFEMFLINLSVSLVQKAIASTSNKTDDKILEIAQIATKHLAKQPNNNATDKLAKEIAKVVVEKVIG